MHDYSPVCSRIYESETAGYGTSGSPDKYVHEFLICNMNTQYPKSAPAINKNTSVNYDVVSEFDVVSKILSKS